MKKLHVLVIIAVISSVFTACTKEGDTINNYTTSGTESAPPKKMLKQLLVGDTSSRYQFTYYKNDPDKMQELLIYSSGVASARLTILYNSADIAEGYQVYTLPANTLNGQGTFKADSKGRITQIINRSITGDTGSIIYMQYQNAGWQPVVVNNYSKSSDRITSTSYISYNSKGNVTDMSIYRNDGSNPIYVEDKVSAVYSDVINPLPRVYYFLLLEGGAGSSSPLYFSNYMPSSIADQGYNPDGSSDGASITNYTIEADADGHATKMSPLNGSSGGNLIFKY